MGYDDGKKVEAFVVSSTQDTEAYVYLIDIDFDKAGGFTWSGEFEATARPDNEKKDEFSVTPYLAPGQIDIRKVFIDAGNRSAENCRNGQQLSISLTIRKNEKINVFTRDKYELSRWQDIVEKSCYEDLQPLLEEHFWEYFRKRNTSSLADFDVSIVAYIKKNELEKAVSSYLQGIIAAYNDSYLRNRGVIEELSSSSGYNFSQSRYGICTGDEKFKQAAGMEKILFSMRELAVDLSEQNSKADPETYFLSKVDSLQKDLLRILQEFEWRFVKRKEYLEKFYHKLVSEALDRAKNRINDGIITEEEKKKIKEYEKKIFTGDKESRGDYKKLVDDIKFKYEMNLRTIENAYSTFANAKAGLGDSSMISYANRELHRERQPVEIQKWVAKAKKNFENLKNAGQGNHSPEAVYTQKQELEGLIDHLLSVSTYADKDGREREMTLLDRCKQAVLEKAEAIEAMWDDGLKKKQYELFAEDVKALRELQYIIGVACGNKAALLYGSEAAQRSPLFGENSGYVTAGGFFAKIEKAFSPQDGLGTEARIDFQIKTSSLLEDIGHQLSKDNFALKLERVLGKINGTVVDGGLGKSLFGDAGIEEIFLQENGDIDIRKLAEVRKSILNAFEEIKDVPASDKKASGEVKYTLDDSLIQAAKKDDGMKNALCEKLLVIEDQILATPSDRGAAYLATDSSGGGSFGEVSDFLSTDAYLDKLYAKINGGSPRTGSFEKPGYSDAGGTGETGLLGKIGGFFRKKM